MRQYTLFTLISVLSVTPVRSQVIDWTTLFQQGASAKPEIREAVRQRGANELIPRVLSENDTVARQDALAIAAHLADGQSAIRLQASGYLLLIAQGRQDSAEVLRLVLPQMISRFSDPETRIRQNTIDAIGDLNPAVPADALNALLDLAKDPQSPQAPEALIGIARMVNQSESALQQMEGFLADKSSLQLYAIRAIARAHVFNADLTRRLAAILNLGDAEHAGVALNAIQAIGVPAIRVSSSDLKTFAASSSPGKKELAEKARQLLESQP